MEDIITAIGIVAVLCLLFSDNVAMIVSHWLNIVFKLPHPGPNDIQGTCWCRRHEGKSKYTFSDYIRSLFHK